MYFTAHKAARVVIAAILGLALFAGSNPWFKHPVTGQPALIADDNGTPTRPSGG